jgi:hypothetical protein
MNALPVISHRLFVEALDSEQGHSEPESRPSNIMLKGIATAVPLELLDAFCPAPDASSRQLRAKVGLPES